MSTKRADRTIIERAELGDGAVIVKLYDDGAVRVDIAGPAEIAITQAWLTGSKNKNVLIERLEES